MITAPLNDWLDRARADSPRAQELCAQLAGKSLAIEVIGSPLALQLLAEPTGLRASFVPVYSGDNASLSLRGGLVALVTALRGDVQPLVERGQITFHGDESLAPAFQELMRLLRPALETPLARLLGPVPGHYIASGLAGLAGWGRKAANSLLRTGGEFLAHESRDLVPRAEAEVHFQGVDALRAQLAAAEARIAALEARLASARGP
jgi:ubiquinone biosynthesis protein UbiJ